MKNKYATLALKLSKLESTEEKLKNALAEVKEAQTSIRQAFVTGNVPTKLVLVKDKQKKWTIEDQIVDLLTNEKRPMKINMVQEKLDHINQSSVRQLLVQLARDHKISRVGWGIYAHKNFKGTNLRLLRSN